MSSSSQQNDSKRVDYFEWYLAWGYIVVKLDVPSNIGIRMLDLKNHVSTFLKFEYGPLIPLRVRSVKTIDVKPSSQNNPKNTLKCAPIIVHSLKV